MKKESSKKPSGTKTSNPREASLDSLKNVLSVYDLGDAYTLGCLIAALMQNYVQHQIKHNQGWVNAGDWQKFNNGLVEMLKNLEQRQLSDYVLISDMLGMAAGKLDLLSYQEQIQEDELH